MAQRPKDRLFLWAAGLPLLAVYVTDPLHEDEEGTTRAIVRKSLAAFVPEVEWSTHIPTITTALWVAIAIVLASLIAVLFSIFNGSKAPGDVDVAVVLKSSRPAVRDRPAVPAEVGKLSLLTYHTLHLRQIATKIAAVYTGVLLFHFGAFSSLGLRKGPVAGLIGITLLLPLLAQPLMQVHLFGRRLQEPWLDAEKAPASVVEAMSTLKSKED